MGLSGMQADGLNYALPKACRKPTRYATPGEAPVRLRMANAIQQNRHTDLFKTRRVTNMNKGLERLFFVIANR